MTLSTTEIEHWDVHVSLEPWADIADWTEAPEILPLVGRRNLWPEVSFTKFEYFVGNFVKHFEGLSAGVKSPVARMRWFIRLRLYNAADDLLDDWIGIINRTDLERVLGGTTNPTGNLYFTAFGVEGELAQQIVTQTLVNETDTASQQDHSIIVDRAYGFNVDPVDSRAERGNRYQGADFMFSRRPNQNVPDSSFTTYPWPAKEAIEYTLRNDASVWVADGADLPNNVLQWKLKSQTNVFNSLPLPYVSRERRTVSEILQEIVQKKSGIVARCGFELPDSGDVTQNQDKLVFFLEYFSTAASAVTVGLITIPAAPVITALDLRPLKDVVEYSMSESAYEKFDQVVCEGAYVTTTFTDKISNLIPIWESGIESEYLNPDVTSAPTDGEKLKLADELRGQKKFEELFRTWAYNGPSIINPIDGEAWSLVPLHVDQTNLLDVTDIPTEYSLSGAREDNFSYKELSSDMRWKVDNFGDQKSGPVVFVPHVRNPEVGAINYAASSWLSGDTLSNSGGWITEDRQWSIQIKSGRSNGSESNTALTFRIGPSVSLDVQGGSQLFIAKDKAATATHLNPQNDPRNEKIKGLNYSDFIFTACYETDFRIVSEYPVLPTAISGAPLRKKYLDFSWFRLDVQLPNTVTGVDNNLDLVYEADGVFLRDDRVELRNFAAAAWQIYSLSRRPFSLTVQVMAFGNLKPGTFVSTVQTAAGTDTANVIVSQVEFDFRTFSTKFITEFEEVDVKTLFFNGRLRQ